MKKKIIIMEDDHFLTKFYSFVFNKIGFDSEILEDGDVFFQKLNSVRYDLILMDLSLKNTYLDDKKVDGVELSRLVKEDDELKKTPVLLVTAHQVDYQSKHLFLESLADDYIIKPITDVRVFIDKINSVIEKYQQV